MYLQEMLQGGYTKPALWSKPSGFKSFASTTQPSESIYFTLTMSISCPVNDLAARKCTLKERHSVFLSFQAVTLVSLLCSGFALAQAPGTSSGSDSSGLPGPAIVVNRNTYSGSVPEGKATADVLPISFKEAIDRGLRNNIGVLLQSDNTLAARGQRWHELSELMPHVSAQAGETVAQQ